jgi:hypothetical protein
MERRDVEADLHRQETEALETARRFSPWLLPVCLILAAWSWVTGDRAATGFLVGISAFALAGTLLQRWLQGSARERSGQAPAARGTFWSPIRYRWFHSADVLAVAVYTAILALAISVLAFFVARHNPLMALGFVPAVGLCLAIGYKAWRLASPDLRELDRLRLTEIEYQRRHRHRSVRPS